MFIELILLPLLITYERHHTKRKILIMTCCMIGMTIIKMVPMIASAASRPIPKYPAETALISV